MGRGLTYLQRVLKLLQLEQEGVCPSHFCLRFLQRWQASATRARRGRCVLPGFKLVLFWSA